jgi:hypothetical protein
MDAVLDEIELHDCPTALVSDDHTLIAESLADGKSFACLFADGMEGLTAAGLIRRLNLSRPLPRFDVRYVVRGPFQRDRTMHQLTDCLASQNETAPRPARP